MKVALVYDRVNKWGGAERVLLALHEMFPEAPLYTSVSDLNSAPWAKVFSKVVPSFLQKIPFAKSNHEFLGVLTPIAFESFSANGEFDEYNLVISVTSEAAKGIITKPGTLHICYCLTPTRYLWSGYDIYFKNPILKFLSKPVVSYLRKWDKIAAQRPDILVAISTAVKDRIKKYYNRQSEIVFPPIDSHHKNSLLRVSPGAKTNRSFLLDAKSDYFLVVSRLVPYKRVDLAVKVFNRLKLPLVIVGTGSERLKLRLMAGKNIKFVGEVTDSELADYYKGARALIMPQEEDFGMVSVEAQAFGVPVIAYKKGGVLDSVIEGKTGALFDRQTPESLIAAVERFDKMVFNPGELVNNAKNFSKERFKKEFLELVNNL